MSAATIYQCRDFLAVNFYAEISNTFEESLCDALIEEDTFLFKERHNDLPCLDEFYTKPWNQVKYDKEFIINEANNVKESIGDICQDAQLIGSSKWFLLNENHSNDFRAPVVEENLCIEKKLDVLREKAFYGEYQLLDEPPIPFTLVQCKRNFSIHSLLKKLPAIEMEEFFDSSNEALFGDENLFFEAAKIEEVKKVSYIMQIPSEESTLSEIQLDKILYLENGVVKYKCLHETNCKVILNDEQGKNLDKGSTDGLVLNQNEGFLGTEPHDLNTIATAIDICGDNSKIEISVQNNSIEQSCHRSKEQSEINKMQSEETDDLLNHSEFFSGHNSSDELKWNEDKGLKYFPELDNFSLTDYEFVQDNIEFTELIKSSDSNIRNDIQQNSSHPGIYSSQNFERDEYDEYNVSDEFIDSNRVSVLSNANKFPPSYYSNSFKCVRSETIDKESNENCVESKFLNKENSLLEKILDLQYSKKHSINKHIQNWSQDLSNKSYKNVNNNTVVRKKADFGLTSPIINKDTLIGKAFKSSIPKVLKASAFINLRKLDYESSDTFSSQLISSDCENMLNYTDFQSEQCASTFPPKNESSSLSQSHIFAEPGQSLSEMKVDNILVNFPDAFIDVALMFEAAAIPLLQSLIHVDKFNFPLNFTLADIPSYKTCFLLNQESKRCQDNGINLLQNGNECLMYITKLLNNTSRGAGYFTWKFGFFKRAV